MIGFLRSPYAILAVLVLALAAQVPHATKVFWMIGGSDEAWYALWVFSLGFAIALEVAVLVFVMHGATAESYAFAIVSIAMNLCYYALRGTLLFSSAAFPAWLVSFALPVAIARYSHLAANLFSDTDMPSMKTDHASSVISWFASLRRPSIALQVALPRPEGTRTSDQPKEVMELTTMQLQATQPIAENAELQDEPQVESPTELPAHVLQAHSMKVNGMTIAEIAIAMQKSERTVSNYLKAAKDALQLPPAPTVTINGHAHP